MTPRYRWLTFLRAVFFVSFFLFFLSDQAFSFDHTSWDLFLKKYVNEQGEVNYAGIKQDRTLLDEYLNKIKAIDTQTLLLSWSREEKLALWLNVYHVGIVLAVINHYPIKSIQEIPGLWDDSFIPVGDKTYSLNQVQEGMLMDKFHDEKIRMALSCGAKSCPKMRNEAFTPERVDGQLFIATREFVNNAAVNQVKPGEKKIRISKIFQWYAKDFNLNYGVMDNDRGLEPEQYAVLAFISYYLESGDQKEYLEQGNYKVKYLPFDWALNEWRLS